MSKTAFLFPGQASQFVGMAKDLHESFPLAREIFTRANKALGFDLQKICFEGPEDELKKTSITQPAIFVHSFIVAKLLDEKGVHPSMAAGHSLGEYSALAAAGVLEFDEALHLVKLRSELMHEAGAANPGTMAAIIGLEPDEIDAVCREASSAGVVQAANFNSPGQVAISGSLAGIEAAMALAKGRGAKKVVELKVGGAFHSPLMSSARAGLREALDKAHFKNARFPVYVNVTAKPETDGSKLKKYLDEQLTSPVRWAETIENMIAGGAKRFLEIGPGSVLAGLLKRINREFKATTIGTVSELSSL
jgi:[acyl-carrier-protein] S-malonyltransferase